MEIEEFIEQDILVYLDRLLESDSFPVKDSSPSTSAYLTRDYEEELLKALDHNDIPLAKRVLHDLKGKFDESPNGTPERQQLKLMLMELYEKFKSHIEAQVTFSKMDEDLSSMMGSKAQREVAAPKEDHHMGEEEIRSLLASARSAKDPQGAANLYREAKKKALAMSEVPEEILSDFKDAYLQIKSMLEPPQAKLDESLLVHLEREKELLTEALESHDMDKAISIYRRMRTIAPQLHDKNIAEETARKLVKIHDIMKRMRSGRAVLP